ncbi:MAG: hypothetical protein Q7S12_04200 [bacterium]|nr:hypothetical protein [bacterium]
MNIQIEDWGVGVPIRPALEKQDDYWAERVYGNVADRLIFVEHEPVYTVGASLTYHHSLEKIRQNFKCPLYKLGCGIEYTRRGGLATYQGPGILSVYCIFKTDSFIPGILNNILLSSAKSMLQKLELKTHHGLPNAGVVPGLYIGCGKKIVSVGLQFSRGVTRFGMAVSLDPEEKYLEPLIPCGLKNVKLTSLALESGLTNIAPEDRLEIKTVLALEIQKFWNNYKQKTLG